MRVTDWSALDTEVPVLLHELETDPDPDTAAWMHQTAVAAERPKVATAVTELFGTVTCPECDTAFVLGDRLVDEFGDGEDFEEDYDPLRA